MGCSTNFTASCNMTSIGDKELETSCSSTESLDSDVEDFDPEPILFDSTVNPSETTDYAWIYSLPPKREQDDVVLGKWLVFRPYSQIDETWHLVRKATESGVLRESTRGAKCSGLFYDPCCHGPGPKTSGVICVYTMEEDVDRAGFILINMLKHDLKYKTDEATLDGDYSWKGKGASVCLKTLYWNNGKPSFVFEGKLCRGPRCHGIKDEWRINCVAAPESIMSTDVLCYGRWVIVPKRNLTELWHLLKDMIKSGELGAVEMVCPPKINFKNQNEEPVFHLYTGRKNKEFVGLTVANIVGKDMVYELGKAAYRSGTSGSKVTYNHRIVWNDGDPEYIMTLVRPRPH